MYELTWDSGNGSSIVLAHGQYKDMMSRLLAYMSIKMTSDKAFGDFDDSMYTVADNKFIITNNQKSLVRELKISKR